MSVSWLNLLWRRRGTVCGLAAVPFVAWSLTFFPRRPVAGVLFLTVITLTGILINLAWWLHADQCLTAATGNHRRRRWSRGLLLLYMLAVCTPLAGTAFAAFEWQQLPLPAAMWVELWHIGLILAVPVGATLGMFMMLTFRAMRACRNPIPENDTDLSRRAILLRSFVAAPILITAGGTLGGMRQMKRFKQRRYVISPPGLPERLKGLTITHLSDIHAGLLFRPSHLRSVVDAANRLNSDLVVITGDIIDNSNNVLPDTLEILRGLQPPNGLYLCLGNHDLLDNGDALIRMVQQAGLELLINEHRWVGIGGEHICIGGLDWSYHDRSPEPGQGDHREYAARTFDPGDVHHFKIALAHHPHAFDALAEKGVHLTLSGHTHGGQFMLTPPGWPEMGAGKLFFRYVRGFYSATGDRCIAQPLPRRQILRSEHPLLFVNSGIGNWFPYRINAPPEIVQLQLV